MNRLSFQRHVCAGGILPEESSHIRPYSQLKQLALQLYRFFVVALIGWLLRDVAVRQPIQGDSPVTAEAIVSLLPEAP